MGRILEIAGAPPWFASSLPGAGDMYVTAVGGRTIRLGRLLGAGHSYVEARQMLAGETLEAAEIIRVMGMALPHLEAKGKLKPGELPLMRKLVDIVVEGGAAELPLEAFFEGSGSLVRSEG
jgi:glycerol-3-phosphate dehydrogenase (NAD(P)+)